MKYVVDIEYVFSDSSKNFHQFYKGKFGPEDDPFWNESSVYIDDEVMSETKLYTLFKKVISDYSYCGDTAVSREQWSEIEKLALQTGGQTEDIVRELSVWVNDTFAEYDCFTIIGL